MIVIVFLAFSTKVLTVLHCHSVGLSHSRNPFFSITVECLFPLGCERRKSKCIGRQELDNEVKNLLPHAQHVASTFFSSGFPFPQVFSAVGAAFD